MKKTREQRKGICCHGNGKKLIMQKEVRNEEKIFIKAI